ncbi:MAG: hypothetical protein WCW77_05425 [Patescibacteria group bacterium]|jgi:hypothetical protein
MADENRPNDAGDSLSSWTVPEYDKHVRERAWYIIAGIIGALFLVYSFWTMNFLFALIVITASIIIILNDGRDPDLVRVNVTDEGVIVGRKFYDYDDIKNFSIVYKPKFEVKNLYFEFKSPIKHRLSIPLMDMNPLPIRDILLKYLPEDLDRLHPPASEGLARFFKL